MRFGMMLAAGAALMAAAPAGAVTLDIYLGTGLTKVTSGATTTCPAYNQSPDPCTIQPPQFLSGPGRIAFDVPQFDGTFNFSGQTTTIFRDVYNVTGTLVFSQGNLISTFANFDYIFGPPCNQCQTYTSTRASGTLQNFFVERRDTHETLGPVPEPATWAMMLAGFGLVGFAMRRRGHAAMLAAKV